MLQVGFLLDDLQSNLQGSNEDFFVALLGQVDSTLYNMIIGRTPRDSVTKRGQAKSQEEHIQASWQHEIDLVGRGVTFGTDFVYAPVLDLGGYRGVGPRTVAGEGGVYSRQAPRGILQDLFKDPATIDKAVETIVAKLPERLGNMSVSVV
jgi:hypothetical protein